MFDSAEALRLVSQIENYFDANNDFQVYTEGGKPPGYDRVRGAEIGNKDFELDVLEEAYTTEHWLVRIYKVKDLRNRGV